MVHRRPHFGGGDQFHRRRAFFARQSQIGGAVRGDVPDVPAVRHTQSSRLVDSHHRADRLRGHHQRLQFHGRHKRNNRRLFPGGAVAAGISEQYLRFHIARFPICGGIKPAGVLLFQFPQQGEMLRGRCWFHNNSFHRDIRARQTDAEDERLLIHRLPGDVRCGHRPHDLSPHSVARAPGTGSPQACFPADGKRTAHAARRGFLDLHGTAAADFIRPDIVAHKPLSLSWSDIGGSLRGVCHFHETQLPSA